MSDQGPIMEAAQIARAAGRALIQKGAAPLRELSLPNGRRADLFALDEQSMIHIVEVKSCLRDFQSDQKWPEYLPFCDYFSFCVPMGFPVGVLPEEEGYFLTDGFEAAEIRPPITRRLAPARRKSLVLRAARLGAHRLEALHAADLAPL